MLVNILCIDDDPIVEYYVKALVKKSEIADTFNWVSDGQKGLEYLEKCIDKTHIPPQVFPALILLDLNMPVMNGWQFLEEYAVKFAPLFPKTKIVIVSSSIDKDDIDKSTAYSFVMDYISKPVTVVALTGLQNKWEHA